MNGLLALIVAAMAPAVLGDPAQEARAQALGMEIRCVQCENEPIAQSTADIAVDMRALVRERIAAGHINLQETLCDDLARVLLAHPLVRAVRVSTEKPDVYPDCDAVGVEVFHFKPVDGPVR